MARQSRDVDAHVGSRVRERRKELGMSQSVLGDALGISFQQVQKYEIGINRVAASRLWDLAKELEVDVGYFFEGIKRSGRSRASVRRPHGGTKRTPSRRRKTRR